MTMPGDERADNVSGSGAMLPCGCGGIPRIEVFSARRARFGVVCSECHIRTNLGERDEVIAAWNHAMSRASGWRDIASAPRDGMSADVTDYIRRLQVEIERCNNATRDMHMRWLRTREALKTIIANTEPDAIKHRDYEHLAKNIYDCACAALGLAPPPTPNQRSQQ